MIFKIYISELKRGSQNGQIMKEGRGLFEFKGGYPLVQISKKNCFTQQLPAQILK